MTVPELMLDIGLLTCYSNHNNDNDIAQKVGERMNAVGDKRRASSEYSAYYFCQSENSVDPETDPGYATRFGNRISGIIALAAVDFIKIGVIVHF